MGRMRKAWLAGCVAALTVAGLAAAAASRPPRAVLVRTATLGLSNFPGYPMVAADGTRGFDAVWAGHGAIMASHWSARTRRWASTVALPGEVPGQWEPQVAGAPSGAAAIVWTQGSGPDEVEATYRSSAEVPWPSPEVIFSAGSGDVSYIAPVGMDSHGDAFVGWITSQGAVDVSEHAAASASWSAPVTVATGARPGSLGLAVGATGTAAAVWEHHLSGGVMSTSHDLLYVSVKPSGRTAWLAPVGLGRAGAYPGQGNADIHQPQPYVAVGAAGTVFAVWQWPHRNAKLEHEVGASFYPRVGILTAATDWRKPRFVALSLPALDPTIAADGRGFATVLWETPTYTVEAATVSSHARVLATRSLGPGARPQIASDGRGDLAGVWGAASVKPAGRRWCPPMKLNASDGEWSVAIAPNGLAAAVWEHWPGGTRSDVTLVRLLPPCAR